MMYTENVLEHRVPLSTFAQYKSLFDLITAQGKRVIIDLQAVEDAYSTHEISEVVFLHGPNNLADSLTKIEKC